MSFYREPDWQGPFTVGMWQIRYDLDRDSVLLFFRGGVQESAARPEHEWGAGILRGKARDEDAERQLADCPDLRGKIHWTSFGDSPWLCVHGRDIDAVTDQARALLAKQRSGVAGA